MLTRIKENVETHPWYSNAKNWEHELYTEKNAINDMIKQANRVMLQKCISQRQLRDEYSTFALIYTTPYDHIDLITQNNIHS